MAALSEAEKRQIVVLLAQFTSYSGVVAIMRDQLGIEIDRFQVRTYDPTNPRYAAGERWRAIFEAARDAYMQSVEGIPIAHKAFRLNELQRNYLHARDKGNLVLACAILEQAAKEAGGMLTNQSNVTIEHARPSYLDLSFEERRARVAEMLREALSGSDSTARSPQLVTAAAA